MSIRILSEETINKIAAGEVVEDPASVVKELVENAIDAEASSITIEIKAGGFSLIRISDDGCGMGQDDLLLSLERHATSKLRSAEELNSVYSMGFRGEALASIAAISRLRLLTCQKGARVGAQLSSDGGKLGRLEDASRDSGTTVEVRSLFYNVPARKKFQKSAAASQAKILKVLTKLALAKPQISIKLLADEKALLATHVGTLEQTCREVLGERFLKGSSPVEHEENCCHIRGHLGAPLDARKNRLGQYLFVNGRGVICPEICRGVYDGYGTRLGSQEHPTFLLHMTLPPEWIDVNVHPQKREIRLREVRVIQEAVRRAVLQALQGKQEEKKPLPPLHPFNYEALPPLRFQESREERVPTFNLEESLVELPVVGQFSSFLLLDGRMVDLQLPHAPPPYDGLILVDLNAAHARILYERFLSSGVAPLQVLMIPLTLDFAPHECEKLSLHLKEIETMGVEMRPFGESCLIVDALTPEIDESSVKSLIHALLEEFDQNASEKELQKKLALTVSRYASSQKKGWTILEARHLVKKLLKTDSPFLSPKGKPTMVHLSHEKISGNFQKTR
ncbi:MAG: DNA mismatch repair protein MutL [Chlamydiae bacterium]|nr:DNA mismatch repair protein MutL [Chlamydiota bacterium]